MRDGKPEETGRYETAHSTRGIDQAERDAVNYKVNGKTLAQRRAEQKPGLKIVDNG